MSSIPQEQRCTGCSLIKPLSAFGRHSGMKSGLRSRCKVCRRIERAANAEAKRESDRKYRERKRSEPKPVREINWKSRIQCKKCGKMKRATEFRQELRNKSGLSGACSTCEQAHRAEWYRQNAEDVKRKVQEYRQSRAEELREKRKVSYLDNRQKYHIRNQKKYQALTPIERAIRNAEKQEWRRKDYKVNTAKHLAARHKRIAQARDNGGTFTADEWNTLCRKYGNHCLCCGEQGKLSIDHVVPLSKGGRNDISNLQPLCLTCNTRKNDQEIDYRIDSPYEVR